MLVLIGKAASGKDTVKSELVKKHGFHPIVTYTTRPIRPGETKNITYHYISNDEFLKKIDDGFFAEWKKYIVDNELWYYGTAKEDLTNADENAVIILTPNGVKDIKALDIKATVIYIYANILTIRNRLKKRKDANDKAEDRIQRDIRDFKTADMLADKIVYNNEEMSIDNVVDNVLFHYRRACENEKK